MGQPGINAFLHFEYCDHPNLAVAWAITSHTYIFLTAVICPDCNEIFDAEKVPGTFEPMFLPMT